MKLKIDPGKLTTERRNPRTEEIDTLSIPEILRIINDEDKTVPLAVEQAIPQITRAVELVTTAFRQGGRLFYIGAGTSGRLGVLDASECPPTFSAPPEMVQGIIAGGYGALVRAVEGAEDYPEDGARDLQERGVNHKDVVFGIATGSRTPYVLGALEYAHSIGCKTIFFNCNPDIKTPFPIDVIITVVVGPEVITGSTRMKAGTATKLVLNMVTTTAMVKIGKTYGNLMVDLQATNQKLIDRGTRIISELTGLSYQDARELLFRANKSVKTALVMELLQVNYEEAVQKLKEHNGFVRFAFENRVKKPETTPQQSSTMT